MPFPHIGLVRGAQTDEEVRDYRAFLTGVKGYKAATVNAYLAPLRAIVRDQGRTLKVKGVRQTRPLIETLDGRDLGRLINALDGPDWQDKRDVALINVLARAGLRVSEALALKVGDVEINARSGALLVRHGKGMKERPVPLAAEARAVLRAYLKVRPGAAQDDTLFLSRTLGPLDPRDAQRIVAEAAADRRREGQGDAARAAPLLRHPLPGEEPGRHRHARDRAWATPTSARPPVICTRTRSVCRRWWRRCEREGELEMMRTPIGFYLFLGAALSWVGLLMLFGLRHRARIRTVAERDLSHLVAVEAFLAQLLAQAGTLGPPIEIERDAREFQSLVADVLHGGAPFTVEEMQDLSDFLHDLTLALPLSAGGWSTPGSGAGGCR